MSVLPQASLFLGIIPALFIMYICLKGYDKYYKEKYVFLFFIAGIIVGFIAAFVQYMFYAYALISIVLLAFFNQLFKTIILNLGRLQQKKETPIYGLSLGLGFGSSFTPFMLIAAAVSSAIPDDIRVFSLIGLGTIGLILFHGATGSYIGYGVYNGSLFKKVLYSVLLELPISFFVAMTVNPDISSLYIKIGFVLASIIYGLIICFYVTTKILPNIKKDKEKKS